MKLNELSNEELYKYLQYYNNLNEEEKNQINFIVYKNHLMYLKENDIDKFNYYYSSLNNILNTKNNIFYSKKKVKLNNISDIIKCFNNIFKKENDFFNNSLLLNSILINNGLCPIVLYAFNNKIYDIPIDENKIKDLIEFSLMYLYRVVKKDYLYKYEGNLLDDSGAVSSIYLSNNMIIKYPKTYASNLFLMKQEIDSYSYLINTKLKPFIANNYVFDSEKKTIIHDFIDGKNGEYYLFNHISFTKKQIKSLRDFYDVYSSLFNKIILDIHPGNFIWDEGKEQWFIIDLGVLPTIGKEYYEFNTFDEYFENIWINREDTMKRIPIRSIDLDIDLNVKDKEVQYE